MDTIIPNFDTRGYYKYTIWYFTVIKTATHFLEYPKLNEDFLIYYSSLRQLR